MKQVIALLLFQFFLVCTIFSQDDQPKDYLSPAFHAGRRDALRKLMPANSVMAIFAYPVRTFSNDVDYTYHPNPDLYYFTGYKEPNALLLIFKEPQRYKDSITYHELFFVQKRDAASEQWTGRRLGAEGVKKDLDIAMTYTGDVYASFPLNFSGFSKIFLMRYRIPERIPMYREILRSSQKYFASKYSYPAVLKNKQPTTCCMLINV